MPSRGASSPASRCRARCSRSNCDAQVEFDARVRCHHWLAPSHSCATPAQPGVVVHERAGRGQRVGQQVEDAALQAFGRDHGGGIDARPARPSSHTSVQACASDWRTITVAADRIPFAAEIAGDDARRHARGAHQRGVGRREVAAEPALGIEQRGVHRIDAWWRRARACIRGRCRGTTRARRARIPRRCRCARGSPAPARSARGLRSGGSRVS